MAPRIQTRVQCHLRKHEEWYFGVILENINSFSSSLVYMYNERCILENCQILLSSSRYYLWLWWIVWSPRTLSQKSACVCFYTSFYTSVPPFLSFFFCMCTHVAHAHFFDPLSPVFPTLEHVTSRQVTTPRSHGMSS